MPGREACREDSNTERWRPSSWVQPCLKPKILVFLVKGILSSVSAARKRPIRSSSLGLYLPICIIGDGSGHWLEGPTSMGWAILLSRAEALPQLLPAVPGIETVVDPVSQVPSFLDSGNQYQAPTVYWLLFCTGQIWSSHEGLLVG